MKKILIVIFTIGTFLLFNGNTYAESFVEGEFINGEYITKDKGNSHLYVTMQYITTQNGDIVYCLEPFVTFMSGSNYNEIVGDLSSYSKLSKEQIKRIELLSFYGYGYQNRKDSKWYVITQYLIWKAVDEDATFSFTSTLNGTKIKKYEKEMAELEKDILNREKLAYTDKFYVNYNGDLKISFLNKIVYEIVGSDYPYTQTVSGLSASGIKENGTVSFRKVANYYKDKIKLYDSSKNQDLLKPGNIEEVTFDIDIIVQKGKFTLDILKTDDVYTVESDFNNTCYEITGESIESIVTCTGDKEMSYVSDDLPYGDYLVRQISHGVGYKPDLKEYKFSINQENSHPVITVNNFLIKNDIAIQKFACKNDICSFEKDAIFDILDRNGNVVKQLVTDSQGLGRLTLGYGTYNIVQTYGKEGYSYVSSFKEKIVDETSSHEKILYNHYIEVEEPKEEIKEEDPEEIREPEEPDVEQPVEEVVLPPNTGVDFSFLDILASIIKIIVKIAGLIVI